MPLSDIQTDEISFIGYFNVLDHGASEIDPTEAESAMAGFTEYSNGVEGMVEVSRKAENRTLSCRVKDDGWVIAWLDRSNEEFTKSMSDTPIGTYGVMYDWTGGSQYDDNIRPGASDSIMAKAIETLVSNLSNSGSITVNRSDVGVHNYEYGGSATTYTVVSNQSDQSERHNISVSEQATLYDGWATGAASGQKTVLTLDSGTEIVLALSSEKGVRNIVGRGEVDPGDTFEMQSWESQFCVYFLWS